MQVVGRNCATCGDAINLDPQGRGCAACDLVFHKRCLVDPGLCGRCGVRFGTVERRASAVEEARVAAGRPWAIAALAAMPAVSLIVLLLLVFTGHEDRAAIATGRLLITILIVARAYSGGVYSLWFVKIASVVAAILFAVMAVRGSEDASVAVAASALAAAVYAAAAAVLWLHPGTRAFLNARARARQ